MKKLDKARLIVKSADLNFMVIRGTGKVRQFKVSSRLLMFSFLFFLAFTLVSLVAINRYLTLRLIVKQQAKQIDWLKVELTTLTNKLYEAQQQIALLKGSKETKRRTAKSLNPHQVKIDTKSIKTHTNE